MLGYVRVNVEIKKSFIGLRKIQKHKSCIELVSSLESNFVKQKRKKRKRKSLAAVFCPSNEQDCFLL
jgi:hypothetical protein